MMPERIVADANGRKHITTEPLLHPQTDAAEIARLRASLAAIHRRLKFGGRIDSHTISAVIAECEHAVPALIGIEPPHGSLERHVPPSARRVG